jgi:hypothetical protein
MKQTGNNFHANNKEKMGEWITLAKTPRWGKQAKGAAIQKH